MKSLTMEQREVVATTLTLAWHALKSYQYGNSATELAQEAAEGVERGARLLGVTIEGWRQDQPAARPVTPS